MKLLPMTEWIISWPRAIKRLFALGVDTVLCLASVFFAFFLRVGEWPDLLGPVRYPAIIAVVVALPLFVVFGLYRAIFRYAGGAAVMTIGRACALYAIPVVSIFTFVGVAGVPRTIGIIQPLLLFLMVAGSRVVAQSWLGDTYQALWRQTALPQVLIYGAGSAGRQLASAIGSSREMVLAGFLDDDPALIGSTINGSKIFDPEYVDGLIARRGITDVLLAIPNASRSRRTEIVTRLNQLGLHVRTLPAVIDIARGRISVQDLKDVAIEDLLARSPIPPAEELLRKNIAEKVVLVTGAGGSIGSELCRQIAKVGPANLLIVDVSEYALYAIHQELQAFASASQASFGLIALIGSVRDSRRMEEIVATWRPDTIYHAAAYKHVPLVEHNPVEGIANNVIGTLTMAQLARRYAVADFVLISSDKAVRPTNVMGASKRLAELVLQAFADDGAKTCFSMVRFGNVLGSSGSVVPLFRRQISEGGPVTVTHPEMTRYFMTIPEAAQLVLQAGAMAEGGDVFVLDMGEPVRILDLARNMIELSGLTVRDEDNPDGDIEIRYVGLRPGEKMYEELLIGNNPAPSAHPRILRASEHFTSWPILNPKMATLTAALNAGDTAAARSLLRELVPEFKPTHGSVDWITHALPAAVNDPH